MLAVENRVQPNRDVIVTELVNNEAVLLHLDSKLYFSLNTTGLRIWKLLSEGFSLLEISEQLHDEFDVSLAKAQQSVLQLIDQLHAERLIDIVEE